jgi:Domain of unknown function (DUF4269)
MQSRFDTLDYLKAGTSKQQAAYRTLMEADVFIKLQSYSPILTGTIPINIDIDNSDLDIICCWNDKDSFIKTLTHEFAQYKQFKLTQKVVNDIETVICSFLINNFSIEIFGQNRHPKEQEAYKHMLIEFAILNKYGENFRKDVIQKKKAGYKTEPAFAKLLALEGDPYEAILNYKIK